MAALGTTQPNLLDLAKRLDPDDSIAEILEILNLNDSMIEDVPFVEGNLLTGHMTTIRTGIPQPTWAKMYQHVQPTKSTTAQVTDNCGTLKNYNEVDKKLADLNGNKAAFLVSEARPTIEGLRNEFMQTLLYGNEGTEPEAFTGLAPRFNSTTAANGDNIILGGSADTDNTSIWLIVWGENSVHGIYPKGSKAGWIMEDQGQRTKENSSGLLEVYRSYYEWNCGLSVRDWRQIVRIPNIELSALTHNAASGANIPDLMAQACDLIHELNGGKAAFYMNRRVRGFLRRQMKAAVSASTLTIEQLAGPNGAYPVMYFDGIPVRRCDSILNNEALVA